MPKTFPIRLEVEEIALGTVLRKLHDMPGILDLHLDLGHGGQGAGRKELEKAAANSNSGSSEQIIIKLLLEGPKYISELSRAIGGAKSRAYGAIHQLKKKGLTEAGVEKGMHQLTAQARAQLGGALALPAPASKKAAKVKHGPKGRAIPGSGNIVLRELLADGPKAPVELRQQMTGKGMSPKSISGVLDRARKAALIKKNGTGYELTAKGLKIEMPAAEVAAHG
jgi:DNA-binding PadR family transcriptional regulator